ncbi:MAG TPA: hypothetical protein VK137_06310, partial [Planctomycetaceae bacterium]|nr:hypothetical protein [Planctomycetaceae bacterium]
FLRKWFLRHEFLSVSPGLLDVARALLCVANLVLSHNLGVKESARSVRNALKNLTDICHIDTAPLK